MKQYKMINFAAAIATSAALLAGCSSMSMSPAAQPLKLAGSNEVPPNSGTFSAVSTIAIAKDHTVTGTITTTGITGTAAHIHMGAPGTNGPVIVPFTKTAPDTFAPPAGATVTDDQYAAYLAGNLYVNVHSAEFPGGAMRAQLKP
jgi:hypothetical protein